MTTSIQKKYKDLIVYTEKLQKDYDALLEKCDSMEQFMCDRGYCTEYMEHIIEKQNEARE